MSIFIESYETTIKEYGYPSDFDDLVKWEYKDYLFWMIDWLPEKILKKIKRNKNINRDDDLPNEGVRENTEERIKESET